MSRSPRADEARRDATRERLLHAALELFAEHGYGGTSMSALARRAGVSKGLVYHYFADKSALRMAVIERHQRRIAAIASEVPEGPPAMRLAAVAHRLAAHAEAEPEPFRMLLRMLADDRPEVPETPGLVELFAELGVPDPELEARWFQSALLGILVQSVLSPRPSPVAPLVDRLLTTLPATP